jgi:hypothetical protein
VHFAIISRASPRGVDSAEAKRVNGHGTKRFDCRSTPLHARRVLCCLLWSADKPTIRDELVAFHKEHYVASRMHLVWLSAVGPAQQCSG